MLIGGELIGLLQIVDRQSRDFCLALSAQTGADGFHDGAYDVLCQVMAAHEKIGGGGRHAQCLHALAERAEGLAPFRELTLELTDAAIATLAQGGQALFGMAEVETVDGDNIGEVAEGETVVAAIGVCPDVPQEEAVDDLAILLQEGGKIEDVVVIERGHDADALQRGGIALEVLYGIDVGVEHIGRSAELLADGRGALLEIVIVGIHAGYHVEPETIAHGHLFTPAEGISAGEGDIESHLPPFAVCHVGSYVIEQLLPEQDVVVALYVCHDAAWRRASCQGIGGSDVGGIEVGGQAGHSFLGGR